MLPLRPAELSDASTPSLLRLRAYAISRGKGGADLHHVMIELQRRGMR